MRAGRLLALLLGLALAAPAYYHFVRFQGGVRQVERFDLDALVDSRVFFYASTARQPRLSVNDSVPAVLSQIRQALAVWDGVPTSALRVGFGGVIEDDLPGSTPAGEIVFAELPPGVLGLGGPVTRGRAADGSPVIIRSQVLLSADLVNNARSRTSFSELFFSTLVHEIGHALGLQHTLSSSAMSTDVTRATTRARPLGADDVAGLAALYPAEDFARAGAISGTVLFSDGRPVSLASIAAVRPDGETITALSDPDGQFVIAGLRAGEYLLYAQSLPPSSQAGLGPANIVLPVGVPDQSQQFFRSAFLGGVQRPESSRRIVVAPGETVRSADFRVQPAAQPAVRNVTTYAFPGNNAPGVHPAFLDLTDSGDFALAVGPGLDSPSLQVETFDPELRLLSPRSYEFDARFTRLDFAAAPFVRLGPVDLLFRTSDNFYVLPSAVRLTARPAPLLYWLTPAFLADQPGAWTLRGDALDPGSVVYFDGEPARILDFSPDGREFSLLPPPAAPGHHAVVTVYNPDGQSSAFTLPDGNVIFKYPDGPAADFSVSDEPVRPGQDVVLQVSVRGMDLELGRVELGVGSSDVVVRRVEVLAPDRFRAVVYAAHSAEPGDYDLTLVNGLQVVRRSAALRVSGPEAALVERPNLRFGSLVNAATGQPSVAPGTVASLFGQRLVADGVSVSDAVRVTFNGIEALLTGGNSRQLNLIVPASVAPGLAEIRVHNGAVESAPMLAEIGRVAPGIFAVFRPDGVAAGADAPIRPGAEITLLATGLGVGSPFIQLDLGGRRLFPDSVELSREPGVWMIRTVVPVGLFRLGEAVDLSLLVNGRRSNRLPLSFDAAVRTSSVAVE